MASIGDISKITLPGGSEYNVKDIKLLSRGQQLVVNGNGMIGDNTNFPDLIFDGSKSCGSPGSFTRLGSTSTTPTSKDLFPVNPDKTYEVQLDATTLNHQACIYTFLDFFDVNKQQIAVRNHGYYPESDVILTADFHPGDTQMSVNDASYFASVTGSLIGIMFWDYTNSFGYTYPSHTYTRNLLTDVTVSSVSNNVITLSKPLSGNITHLAGTAVSRIKYGGTFKYVAASNVIPSNTEWTHYRGLIGQVDYSGQNVTTKFPPGVAYCRFGILWNYNKKEDQIWMTNISVREYRDAKTVNGHTVEKNVPSSAVFTDTTYAVATTAANGLMSSGDKAKVNGLKALASKDNVSTTYKPAGTVSKPSFTGTSATISIPITAAGSVSKPNIDVTPTTVNVSKLSNGGTVPSLTMTVDNNQVLVFSWSAGSMPTFSNQAVVTGISAALHEAPTFTGSSVSGSTTYTPAGSVSQPTFTGTSATLISS